MSKKPAYKRRQYFVKKDYQLKFILKFCLILFAGSIISTGVLFLFSQGTLTSSFEHSRLVIKNTGIAIMPAVILTNIITLILISIAAVVVVLFVSHKIAGPMFRFEKDLKEIGEGNLTETIALRDKDQFTKMAESLNIMTASLHDKVLLIQTEVDGLLELASEEKVAENLIKGLNHLHETIHQQFRT